MPSGTAFKPESERQFAIYSNLARENPFDALSKLLRDSQQCVCANLYSLFVTGELALAYFYFLSEFLLYLARATEPADSSSDRSPVDPVLSAGAHRELT
jgi:hypothetical protein